MKPTSNSILIFDMDGVILDSLDKLSSCMLLAVSEFCQSQDQFMQFVEFDRSNPGLSRFEKIQNFVDSLPVSSQLSPSALFAEILGKFDSLSLEARISSKIDDSIYELSENFKPANLLILSNCDNSQLSLIVAHFGLHQIFKGGQIGTPPDKLTRMQELLSNLASDDIWSVSDSESDAIIARKFPIKFAFVSRFARDDAPWLASNEYRFSSIEQLSS